MPVLTPRTTSFSEEDYGAGSQNWDVAQSPDGVLYVANSGGVLRYDGLNWRVLTLPGRPTVRAVAWCGDRLYVGGYGEFGYFPRSGVGLGDYVSLSARLPAREQGEEIWNIEVLAGGTVVFQSFSRLYWLRAGEEAPTVEEPGAIMLGHASGDTLLLPVTGRGVVSYLPDGAATLLPGSDPGGRAIVGLAGPAAAPLLATQDRIYRYRAGRLEPWSAEADARLSGQQINRLRIMGNGEVAVGTIAGGVYCFDAGGRLLYQLSFGAGLANNTVLALYEDRSGNLWAGLDRGLDLVVRSEPLRFYRSGGRPIGAAYAAKVYNGTFYVGTNQGLYYYSPASARFELVAGTAGQVWELRETPAGLLCGHNDGTFLVSGDRARRISERSGGWQTIPVPGDSSRLLQANYAGLSTLDIMGGAEARLEGLLSPLRYLAPTGRQNEILALHGSRGAYRVELSDDWRGIRRVDTLREPDLIRPLLARFGDTLLVQTDEGVYHYRDGALIALTHFRGVALAAGHYLLPGRAGTAEWFVVGPDRLTAYRHGTRLGAVPVRLHRDFPYLTALGPGEYLLCLEDGFAVYRPGDHAAPAHYPLQLTLAGDATDRIDYRNNDVRLAYALPVLDRGIRYRYRLRGFSDGWSEWSTRGEREFTNLEEGDYRFEVEADWYGATAQLAFTVLPPWYRTAWAYLAYALLGAGLLHLLYREHRKRLQRQARQLEAVRQRQLQRQRILARNEKLESENRRKSQELANTTLTLAKKNEMLLDLKEELARTGGNRTGQPAHKLLHLIDRNLNTEEDWAIFESHFNEVHEEFLKRLRATHPELTSGDLRLAAYLRMDLSSKEIAPLLHISVRGVENKRYRLRKKLELENNDNLNQYLQDF
ncbi:hypothetical protein CGL56_16435 [Neolewinella marina]|uniref:HTH luxR-type domain-containing protein n=1 Tax=Neolewinella marina TaxID=438751 RepID=A0A2G0CBS3_9BACT|nr:hypothetical protein CGL56_16435 [Neolewinella marina]